MKDTNEHQIDINFNEGTSNPQLPTIVERISEKIGELPISELCEEFFITKVHKGLRDVQSKAYEPMLISIGPYHYQSTELQSMEKHKLRFLRSFLERRGEKSAERYILSLGELELEARKCYVDLPKCLESTDKFVEMMLLDGCFIIEYFYRISSSEIEHDDYFILVPWMKTQICLDLILLENQLPYFVLTELYKSEGVFRDLAIEVFNKALLKPQPKFTYGDGNNGTGPFIKHLLHLVHLSFCPSNEEAKKEGAVDEEVPENENTTEIQSVSTRFHEVGPDQNTPLLPKTTIVNNNNDENEDGRDCILDKICCWNGNNKKKDDEDGTSKKLRRVVKLKEAGVKFKMAGGDDKSKKDGDGNNDICTLFDIKFNNGWLEIPCFTVEDSTETLFRNLVAYEQHTHDIDTRYFSDFVVIMDKFIDTEDDVKLLCDEGIIANSLGDDKAVAQLFNKLCDGLITFDRFYYSDMCLELNKHCAQGWNTFLAKFWGDYFNTPWASVSSIAAFVLLLLTFTQTIISLIG